jgi:hypothetical protein
MPTECQRAHDGGLFCGIFIELDKLAKGYWKDSVFGSTEWIDFELRLKPSYDDSEATGIQSRIQQRQIICE